MEPGGSLSATGPYPEPDESSPHLLTLFPAWVFQMGPYFQVFQPKYCTNLSLWVLHAPPIPSTFTWSH